MEEKDDELQINFGATRCSIWGSALVSTRVLALLKNNNDNALSLSFKIGNE